ncbi:MAG TPA: hypothetical protein P5274_00960 [Candidatus Paceibacterota bacterium]|nr:hypothetical protein [Candidatus Paceibacterota bacterium]
MKKIILISLVLITITAVPFLIYKNKKPENGETIEAKVERIIKERSENPFGTSLFLNNYLGAKEVVEQKTDVLFTNPKSDKPEIKIPTPSAQARKQINTKRAEINALLKSWAELIAKNPSLDDAKLDTLSQENQRIIRAYLEDLNSIVNAISTSNSNLSQTEIDNLQKIVSEAQASILILDQSQIIVDTYVAPIIDTSGKPKLIEGVNND